jgi:hypothetical protein
LAKKKHGQPPYRFSKISNFHFGGKSFFSNFELKLSQKLGLGKKLTHAKFQLSTPHTLEIIHFLILSLKIFEIFRYFFHIMGWKF